MADLSTCLPLTRSSVLSAATLIAPFIHRTPVLTNCTLNLLASTLRTPEELTGTEWASCTPAKPVLRFYFKCENLQRIGAFKVRGAFHAIERLKAEKGWKENGGVEKGVVTHSSGNHAQALALAARKSGIPAHVVMPAIAPASKVAATKGYGATVYFSGPTTPEREALANEIIAKTGARLVPPYDHPDIILGQGTAGLELQEQAAEMIGGGKGKGGGLDAIIGPISGGGLLSGIALSAEGTGVRVFGAEPGFQGADETRRGFAEGKRITEVKSLTIADGLRAPVGELPWGIMYERGLVKGVYAVTEEEIKKTVKLVLERMKIVVEPSGVVPLAVALWNEEFRAMVEREAGEKGWDLGVVFSGGNIAVDALVKLYSE